MNIVSSFLIAASLSMDNLAVTISVGCTQHLKGHRGTIWQISLLFSLAHLVMFSIGYEGGTLLHAGHVVGAVLSCGFLVWIGARMVHAAWRPKTQPDDCTLLHSFKTQVALAVATSLDALWAGVGMAFSSAVFWQVVSALVACVFITSLSGFYLGQFLGRTFGRKMEIIGGMVLILFGGKVLLEGVGIL